MFLPLADWCCFGIFLTLFIAYSWLVESSPWARHTLSRTIAVERKSWFDTCVGRDIRIIDSHIMGLQQNGAAYFGSASLLGVGAGFTLLSTSESLAQTLVNFPVLGQPTPGVLQVKSLILMLVFALAFFQFAWSFRLFGYNAIILGSIRELGQDNLSAAQATARRAAALNTFAGQHFNQAMRLFFFAIPLIFWLISPYALVAATLLLVSIMFRRQFLTVAMVKGLVLAWEIEDRS